MLLKYPKTFHLPFSKGLQNDDRMLQDCSCFAGKEVEISIKMDGENASLYPEHYHARSLDSGHHPSRDWIKAFHGQIKYQIPEGWRFVFENMYAVHSIKYENLETYACLINIWNQDNFCLSLDDTVKICSDMGLTKVKTVDRIKIKGDDFSELERIYLDVINQGEEGIVVRSVDEFHYKDFGRNVAKAVRPDHVTTDIHWMHKKVEKNLLSERKATY